MGRASHGRGDERGAARSADADDAGDVGTSADVGLERHRHRAHGRTPIVRPHGVRALWVVGRHLTRTDVTRLAVEPLLVRCRPDIHDDGRDPSHRERRRQRTPARHPSCRRCRRPAPSYRAPDDPVDLVLQPFLAAGHWLRIEIVGDGGVGQRRKIDRAVEDGPAPLPRPPRIPIVSVGIQRAVGRSAPRPPAALGPARRCRRRDRGTGRRDRDSAGAAWCRS